MTGPTVGSTGSRGTPGPFLSAYLTERFAASFALQFEAEFSIKVSQTEMCSPCHDIEDLELDYLELPVLIRLDLLQGERGKFHLDLGAELAIHLGTFDSVANKAVELKPISGGGVAGLGFQFGAGPGRMTLDARITRWVIPLKDADLTNNMSHIASGNQLSFAVGYAFP
jgi:hypothetical protein